jgi:hypothetical protein
MLEGMLSGFSWSENPQAGQPEYVVDLIHVVGDQYILWS